jgi:hypothetical protein
VHAVLAWLVVEADVPDVVHLQLMQALVAWVPLMGEHLFPTEPEAGGRSPPGAGRAVVAARRAGCRGAWADKVVLHEVRGRVGLAMQALRAHPARSFG